MNEILLGVSGHRDILPRDYKKIAAEVRDVLDGLKKYSRQVVLVCGCAAGADLLVAGVGIEAGCKIALALPFDESEYLNPNDFTPSDLAEYRRIRESGAVIDKFVVCGDGRDRDQMFRAQSVYVATKVHALLTVWNGGGNSNGCGTAAAVHAALNGGCGAVAAVYAPRSRDIEQIGICTEYLMRDRLPTAVMPHNFIAACSE